MSEHHLPMGASSMFSTKDVYPFIVFSRLMPYHYTSAKVTYSFLFIEVINIVYVANIMTLQKYYKHGVKIDNTFVVICIMKAQRRNDVLTKRIAERLKEIRKARHLTQEDVRFQLEMNIGRIEAAQHCITFATLADLCDYYKITLEEFFRGIETH